MARASFWMLAIACVAAFPRLAAAPAQQPTFRASTDLVEIPVSVQHGNRPVSGLTAPDFELLDNGVRQAIEIEAIDAVPVDVDLVIDWSQLGRRYESNRSAPTDVAGLLQVGDSLRVTVFDARVRQGPRVMMQAEEAPGRLVPDLEPASEMGGTHLDDEERRHHPLLHLPAMSDAILAALSHRVAFGRRHLVFVLGWGHDDSSALYLLVPLAPVAARSDALMHIALADPLEVRSMTGGADPTGLVMRWNRRNFAEAAAVTGGRVWNTRGGASSFREVFNDIHRSYLLRYTARGVDPKGWHAITVSMPAHPQFVVRARAGYLGR